MAQKVSDYEILIGKEFSTEVIKLFNEAKRSIDIIVFDWRWYPQKMSSSVQLFNQSIVRCVKRGVLVRAITNTREIIETLKQVGVKAKKLDTPRLVHVKMIIIDKSIVVVGSHNYTESAFQMNYELSVVLRGVEADNRFSNFFNNLYG